MTGLREVLLRHKSALLGSLVLSILLIAGSLNIQTTMQGSARRDMEKSLITVAETSQQALSSWFEEHKSDARIFAESETVRTHALELLRVHGNNGDLLGSPAQRELRNWFAPILAAKNHAGFFLIAPDGISIASTRDSNIGSVNLLSQQKALLNHIFAGRTMVSLPLRSDVPLPDSQGRLVEGLPTMFVGTPVRNAASDIIAILMLRIDPQDDFNKILQRGRIGSSGETYAFDSRGKIISEIRFKRQLIDIGVMRRGTTDSLDVEVRDPGVNLVHDQTPALIMADRPLTLMAKSAIAGETGRNLVGYRDYRGVPVVGAWIWIDDLNFGITSEIDVEEAYETVSSNLTIIRGTTLALVVLIVSILMVSSVNRYRLVASESRYRNLFSNANDAILIVDPESRRILDVNSKASDELQYSRSELLELEIQDLHPISTMDEILSRWEKLGSEGSTVFEARVMRKDKSQFDAEVSISLAQLDGGTVCQAFIRDVTQRKILEEKLSHSQRMETVGTLAGGIAHDFNNLLMPIIGNAQLIDANIDKASNLHIYTDRIVSAGNRAANLVDQLLTLSRKQEPNMAAVELAPILEDAARLIRTSIPLSVILTTDVDKDCGEITADASQIHQIIMNLCINASHAMEETGGELRVSLHPIEADDAIIQMVDDLEEGGYAKISISDTGQGMDETVRRQIFDPFFSTKKQGKGTGLGLSTVHSIVTSHGGHITVKSEPGVGSTFDIYLPFAKASLRDVRSDKERPKGGHEHILVVDDDIDNTTMMNDMLTQLGYKVTSVNSGADALHFFEGEQANVQLLITDFAMPNMNGMVLVKEVREIQHDTPVVMMSGFGAAVSTSDIGSLGVLKLLNKPFTREQLDGAIREALD